MKLKNIPTYIDEEYRINLVKAAKEKIYWISPYFSQEEKAAVENVKLSLSEKNVQVYKSQSKNINDEGYCFSIDESGRHISVKLHPKNSEELNESLLIIDNIACVYNLRPNKNNVNVRFLKGIDKVEFTALMNRLEKEKIVQVNLIDVMEKLSGFHQAASTNENIQELTKDEKVSINGNVNIKVDVMLEEVQAKIKKIHIKAPGTRTDNINFEANDILNIVGKFAEEIEDRLILRWKVFGEDNSIETEYAKFRKELELIKDMFTIDLGKLGRYILVRNIKEFDKQLRRYRIKLKTNAINLIEKKIFESKSILEKLIIEFYSYAIKNSEVLKTCTYFEMQNVVELTNVKFPSTDDITEKSDVLVTYSELSKADITNKELCKQLLLHLDGRDAELYEKLCNIINY